MDKLANRFWDKVIISSIDDCWIWNGNFARDGYGRFLVLGKRIAAHRVAYFLIWGFFPNYWHIDHVCRMKDCVNPLHLEAVTPQENRRRVDERRKNV